MDNHGNKTEKEKGGKKNGRISDTRQCGGHNQVTEEFMEIFFQQTRLIKRGSGANKEDTDSSDSEISYAE